MFTKAKENHKLIRIGIIIALIFLMFPRLQYLTVENVVTYTATSKSLAIIIFLIIYALKAMIMIIPVPVLYVSAGIVFPLSWALIVTYVGLVITLTIGYLNGRGLGQDKVNEFISSHPKVKKFLKDGSDNLTFLCFLSRLIPLPFDLFSMLYGAIEIPFSKYITMSLLGVTPKAIPFILTATHIHNPLSAEFIVPFSASLLVILGVLLLQKNKRSSP